MQKSRHRIKRCRDRFGLFECSPMVFHICLCIFGFSKSRNNLIKVGNVRINFILVPVRSKLKYYRNS